MAFQSLYRRFRPQRFGEVKGQAHLVSALQNAVRDERVGHAYLLSGPRGTGKTSTARLLAKALNCENLGADGEPCTVCDSCVAIENGSSMDLFELDAASNRGIDDVKELVRSVAMGTPGRRKVYILDEVHMLTKEASNALLKTLEEPPDHVVFVLATTDPQKVLPTIRSRTQHVELALVGAELMADHVREIAQLAELDIDEAVVEHVVRKGGGSVRDTLSALDQVVAAGGIGDDRLSVDAIVDALSGHDVKGALTAVADAVGGGADPRDLTEQLTRHLRDMFLVISDAAPPQLSADMREALGAQGRALGVASTVKALEQLGTALVDMRQAADTRLVLEVTLVRLTSDPTAVASGGDASGGGASSAAVAELSRRLDELERRLASGAPAAPAAAPPPSPSSAPPPAPSPAPARGNSKMSAAREALASAQAQAPAPAAEPAAPAPPPPAPAAEAPTPVATEAPEVTAPPEPEPQPEPAPVQPAPPAGTGSVTAAQISAAWADAISAELSPKARTRFQVGQFEDRPGGTIAYLLPNAHYLDRCVEVKDEVAAAIGAHFGAAVALEVELGDAPPPDAPAASQPTPQTAPDAAAHAAVDADLATIDADDLTDAPDTAQSGVERIAAAFPGASIVEEDNT